MKGMLLKVGWKKDFVEKNTPAMPIPGRMGDSLLKNSASLGLLERLMTLPTWPPETSACRDVMPKAHKRSKKKLTVVSLIRGELCCTQVPFGWGTTIPDCTWVSSFEADSVSLGLGGRRAPKRQRLALG